MKGNRIGFHTYPYSPNAGTGVNEPAVWVGLKDQVNADGTVSGAYTTSWANTLRNEWGYSAISERGARVRARGGRAKPASPSQTRPPTRSAPRPCLTLTALATSPSVATRASAPTLSARRQPSMSSTPSEPCGRAVRQGRGLIFRFSLAR